MKSMKLSNLLIIATCLGLQSCTNIEKQVIDDIIIYEDSRNFKTTEQIREDRKNKQLLGTDSSDLATFRNQRQYPPRGEKNRALNRGDYGL